MRNTNLLLIFSLLICIIIGYSCNNSGNEDIPELRFQEVENTIDLKLSDLGEEFRIVRLETDTSYLIRNIYNYLLGEKYIIIYTNTHLLQYSINGSFIRCLAEKGRGPDEFNSISTIFTNSEETYLYCHDYSDRGVRVYDLETGNQTGFINFYHGVKAENAVMVSDNKLAVIPFHQEDADYSVYFQDLNSELINGIGQFREGAWLPSSSSRAPYLIGDKIYCFNTAIFGDTVYCIDETGMSPYFYLSGGPKVDHIEMKGGFSSSLDHLTDSYALLRNIHIKVSASESSIAYDMTEAKYYYYDINADELYEISGFINDILKLEVQDTSLPFLYHTLRLNNKRRLISMWWDAYDFIKNSDDVNAGELSPGLRQQFKTIIAEISGNDNPVMLIGKLK